MKLKYLFHSFLLLLLGLSSCNYLDIVPDEIVKEEDTYETPELVRDYLYSCYAYLPANRDISSHGYWMTCGAGFLSIGKKNSRLSMKGPTDLPVYT